MENVLCGLADTIPFVNICASLWKSFVLLSVVVWWTCVSYSKYLNFLWKDRLLEPEGSGEQGA